MIDAPDHRVELLQSRTITGMRRIRPDGATLEPPIDLPRDNGIENEYEIRRL